MVECSVCHGMCDPGEIVGGVCDECREEEELEERRSSMVARYNSTYVQMELDFGRTSNGSKCTV